ncbi:FAD:protein FMN transferase [Sphingomonas oleivorans]|nr:FAD:protein FMN transferase [Sphingomonas oleivorans]
MGTTWSAHLVAGTIPAERLQAAIQAELDQVVAEMSHWEAGSDLSRFNRAAPGSWHSLPSGFFAVLDTALEQAGATGGAFDPTIGALVDLWGFGAKPAPLVPPSEAAIAAALARTGWKGIEIDRHARRARQPGGVALDFSGIAKGYGVDRVTGCLRAHGIADYLIEVGGELSGAGIKTDGQPWWVDIEAPPGAGLPATRAALHGLSIATSGDYRRFFDHDGRRYAHSLDPRSGRPIGNGLASVAVLHAQCMIADALATALTVLGREAGLAHAAQHGIAALFVERTTSGFSESLSPALAAMAD